MVGKQNQRCWSYDKSLGQPLPFSRWGHDFTEHCGIKQLSDAGGFWQLRQSSVVLAGVRCSDLTPHVDNSSAFPHPFPEDTPSKSLRYVFVQVVGQPVSLEVILFFFKFSHWGSLKGDRFTLLEGWACCCCGWPKHSPREMLIWTWQAGQLPLDSLAPLCSEKNKKSSR